MTDGRAEGLALLRSWLTAEALVRCEFRFSVFAACFRGRLRFVDDDRIEVLSDDTRAEFAVPLDARVDISVVRLSSPAPDAVDEYGGIVLLLLPSVATDDPDEIVFLEVKDE